MKKAIVCALFIINCIFYQACAQELDIEQNTECQILDKETPPLTGEFFFDEWVYDLAGSFSSHFDLSWLMFRSSEFVILLLFQYYVYKVQGYFSPNVALACITIVSGSFVLNLFYDVNSSQYTIDARQRVDSDLMDGRKYDGFNTSLKEGILRENEKGGFFTLAIKQLEHVCSYLLMDYLVYKVLAISCDQCGKKSIYPVNTKLCGKHFFCSECAKSSSFVVCLICFTEFAAKITAE